MTIHESPVAQGSRDREPSLRLTSAGLSLELVPTGAAVRRLEVADAHGESRNVVLGHADRASYGSAPGYHGATVGRYANRIAQGRFTLDGTVYEISANEGPHALHGGVTGFDQRVWSVEEQEPDRVVFALHSPDGDQGFPGNLRVQAAYALSEQEVRIDYFATTDRATVVSLANHSYFNLDGESASTIDQHLLAVAAHAYTPTGQGQIPLGRLEDVADTPFDWRAAKAIGPAIREPHPQLIAAKGLDHNFALDGSGLRPVATLESPARGLTLTVLTDQPGLQVYTGNMLDGTLAGTSRTLYRQGAGIALETQQFPDAPNQPAFPSAVLRPGETYQASTIWRFTTR